MKQKKINSFVLITTLVVLTLILLCCGGSSSSNTDVDIISPEQNTSFKAGETISYKLTFNNFNLSPPFDAIPLPNSPLRNSPLHNFPLRNFRLLKDHPEEVNNDNSHTDELASDSHHNAGLTNPDAKEGHYHVYLDSSSGEDPHQTLWQKSGSFVIPNDISIGSHSLRFELRDNSHIPTGLEEFLFFEITE